MKEPEEIQDSEGEEEEEERPMPDNVRVLRPASPVSSPAQEERGELPPSPPDEKPAVPVFGDPTWINRSKGRSWWTPTPDGTPKPTTKPVPRPKAPRMGRRRQERPG